MVSLQCHKIELNSMNSNKNNNNIIECSILFDVRLTWATNGRQSHSSRYFNYYLLYRMHESGPCIHYSTKSKCPVNRGISCWKQTNFFNSTTIHWSIKFLHDSVPFANEFAIYERNFLIFIIIMKKKTNKQRTMNATIQVTYRTNTNNKMFSLP